jgi:hypothetical protein
MIVSERSALARELGKPLPRPRDVCTQIYSPPQAPFRAHEILYLCPAAMKPNPDLIPSLLRDFYKFCEDHTDRGNDPLLLAGIQRARDDCAFAALEDEVSNANFLTGVIFPSVTQALTALGAKHRPETCRRNHPRCRFGRTSLAPKR